MMASRVTPLVVEVEGVEEDEAEDGEVAGAAGSVVLTHGRFD